MKLSGTVARKTMGKKSKTEYEAITLQSGTDNYILRRPEESPFKDNELEKLVGKKITAEGELVKNVFFVDKWDVVKDEEG